MNPAVLATGAWLAAAGAGICGTLVVGRFGAPGPLDSSTWLLLAVTVVDALVAVVATTALLRERRRDLARTAQLQRDLARQSEQLSDQRRLQLLGSLAAGLAHELGQPLSAARVDIEGLHYLRQLGRDPGPEHVERTLARVGMSILAMTQTIEHLRSLANPASTQAVTVLDLREVVEAVLAERSTWLRWQDASITWRPPEHPVPALADPAGLRLIVTNLLRNAVEAVAGQGPDRRLVEVRAGPGPVVAVSDSGPGIPPEVQQRLFDPFFSTKGGGVRGVGLSLARASVGAMGGEITVASAIGSGTTFSVRLQSTERADAADG